MEYFLTLLCRRAPGLQTRAGFFYVGGGAGEGEAHELVTMEGIEVDPRRDGDAGLVQQAAAELL